MTFLKHLMDLLRLPVFDARVTFGEAPICREDRKDLAMKLWQSVQRRLEPVTPQERS